MLTLQHLVDPHAESVRNSLLSRWSQCLKTSLRNIFSWCNVWSQVFIFSEVPFQNVMSVRGLSLESLLFLIPRRRLRNIFLEPNPWSTVYLIYDTGRVSLVLGVPVRKQLAAGGLRLKFHL